MSFVSITGNVTEPVLTYTNSGKAMVKFRLAESRKKGNEFVSSWFGVVVFDQLAENVAASVQKGTRVTVTGRIEVDTAEKDGQSRTYVSVVADDVAVSLRFATATAEKRTPEEAF